MITYLQSMGIFGLATAALIGGAGIGTPVPRKLNVVATTPDLAALAREIGGDAVVVTALAKPTEDPHFVDAKPSHLVTLNKADVLIEGGAELELGWLPPLLDNARNGRIAAGAPGRIVASQGIKMFEVPVTFDRSKGDVHSLGNPHFLLDPKNAEIIAAHIADHFAQIDPAGAETYRANLKRFEATAEQKLVEWQAKLAPYRGAKIVTYHKDFVYLASRFNLEILETLEPKPGIAPSPAHLAKVVTAMQGAKAKVILVQPYQNRKTAETVARQTGAMVLDAPQQPGAIPGITTYFEVMDHLIQGIADALEKTK